MEKGKREGLFQKFIVYARVVIYCLLALTALFLILNNLEQWYFVFPLSAALLIENAVKVWALKTSRSKIACYVIDMLLLLFLTYFSDGTLISTTYIVILSEFYLSQEKLSANIAMCASSMAVFLATLAASTALNGEAVNLVSLILSAFNDLILIALHFFIFNFSLQMYRKNTEIEKALSELNVSNEKLKKAYDELQEITVLEERQRIAKDIHDTAGHSITTVIMQTEAAKLALADNVEEARQKLNAANLQAKHALEELRTSVHLLSGTGEVLPLKDQLLTIIRESSDGTDIAFRYDIDDVTLSEEQNRFVTNTLKEGISNGLRHGGATAFYVELKHGEGGVSFLLSDNGRGAVNFCEGFGLRGARMRAQSLGGVLGIETEEGEGFELKIFLPYDKEGEKERKKDGVAEAPQKGESHED